jgi:hypothetical protein
MHRQVLRAGWGWALSIAKLMTKELGGELMYRSDDNGNYFRVEFYVIN